MTDPLTLALIAATFLLAGTVKGVVGLGLPTVSLGLLTATLGLQPAMALMLAPAFVTNVWQALTGGHAVTLFVRLWTFLVPAAVAIWIGAQALATVEADALSALLGCVLLVYAAVGLFKVQVYLPQRLQRPIAPLVGAVNGLLTGMTGSAVVPGVLYLQALGLPKEQLVQAMGLLFALSMLALGAAMGDLQLVDGPTALVSLAAVLPALAGMRLGRALRARTDEAQFRRLLFLALAALGLAILGRAVL
jgi:hypothetical protein